MAWAERGMEQEECRMQKQGTDVRPYLSRKRTIPSLSCDSVLVHIHFSEVMKGRNLLVAPLP